YPSGAKRHCGRCANQNGEASEGSQTGYQLPDKIEKAGFCALPPESPNMTFSGNNGVEKNETHHAVDVEKGEDQNEADENEDRNAGKKGGMAGRQKKKCLRPTIARHGRRPKKRMEAAPADRLPRQ